MSKQPTFRDFQEASPTELQKTYNLDQRALEFAQRKVCDGASQNDLAKEYDKFYRRNRQDA
jgi:hypothetical protein